MIQETYRVAQHASVDEQCDFQLDAAKRPSALRRLLIDFFPGDEQEKNRKVKSKAWRRPPPLSVSERSLPARRRGSIVAKNLASVDAATTRGGRRPRALLSAPFPRCP